MNGYGQFCPIAVASELVAERWTPLLVRELLSGSRRFSELQRGLPLISPSLLARRLRMLERAGIVVREPGAGARPAGYALTEAGRELQPVLEALGTWGMRHGRTLLDPHNLDAGVLMWDLRRNVVRDRLPGGRTVVHVHLEGSRDGASRWWLVLDRRTGADLCLSDPGLEVDLVLDGHVHVVTAYWLGRVEFAEAVGRGELRLSGDPALARAFPGWFRRSALSEAVARGELVPRPAPR